MQKSLQVIELVRHFCARDDLSTYDPYDIWKTWLGFHTKDFYNHHRYLGLVPAAALTLFDLFINNRIRWFYKRQEYPIVRAWSALCLLNVYEFSRAPWALDYARRHLEWLKANTCVGYSGHCWGLAFKYAVAKGMIYDPNMPLSTMTPYALEAFVRYTILTGDDGYVDVIKGIHRFFENDIKIMEDHGRSLVTSYAAVKDRRVVNAVSYTMYSLSLALPYIDEANKAIAKTKITKLYWFIADSQNADGSWFYSPDGESFIDCFHSCIVLKNLIKTSRIVDLPDATLLIERGYRYLKDQFLDRQTGLYRRFTVTNKPGLVRFDLYDNAEMLNLSLLLGDVQEATRVCPIIDSVFRMDHDIWSQIVVGGVLKNKNMLRWAVMPYLYGLSVYSCLHQK